MNKDILKLALEKKLKIEEYNLIKDSGDEFWHTTISVDNIPLSGGFGQTKNHSRKVAYSEYLERTKFIEIANAEMTNKKLWGLDIIPTGCGFAAGFDLRNTIIRSLGEALERWVISKWIDENFLLSEKNENEIVPTLDKASLWYLSQFSEVKFYHKEVVVEFDNTFYKFEVGVTICLKNQGVYIGSSAQYGCGNIWQHAFIESYRHLRIANTKAPKSTFPYNRILFFSNNSKIALNTIEKAHKKTWPLPEVTFHKNEFFEKEDFYLSRTIIGGWKSWHLGAIERFLY